MFVTPRMRSWVQRVTLIVASVVMIAACSGPDNLADQVVPTSAESTVSPTPELSRTRTVEARPSLTALSSPTPSPTVSPTITATTAPATATASPTPTVPSTATPAPTAIATPESQAVRLPNVDAHYRIDVTELNVDTGYVRASETISISAFHDGAPKTLYLQVVPAWDGFFTLTAMTLDGMVIQPEVLNDGFTLAVPIPPGSTTAEIGIEFELNVGVEASGWGGTSIDGSVLRLGYWFPIISTDHGYSATLDPSYTRVASFNVSLIVAPDVAFAHTGEIVNENLIDDGRVRYEIYADGVRDFALALSRDYTVESATSASGVVIELYSIGTAPETRSAVLGWAVGAIDQLSGLIGPYPYETFRIADAGPSMPGGVEFPGMIYYNPDYYQLDRLIYHEVAHQWLYGIIGTRTLEDGWIDEGGAEFFERGLPTGFSEIPEVPPGGYQYPLDARYDEMVADASRQWYFSIYEQGARFYYEVAWTMGWDAFWAAMRALYADHAFGIATAWDVLSTWQAHSAVDLRPLYAETFRYDWIDRLPEPGG